MSTDPTTGRSNALPADVYQYLLKVSLRELPVQVRLREATAVLPEAVMQVGPEQGQFMGLLVKLLGAKRCIELGVFTGYSALATALALPPDGLLVACDVNREWTDIGRPFWREAGVESRIDLRLQPALKTIDELLRSHGAGSFDFAFVDADKPNYRSYYEALLKLVRRGGLIAIDNTLGLSGRAILHLESENALALRAFNEQVLRDERVDISMLPIGEGLTLLRIR